MVGAGDGSRSLPDRGHAAPLGLVGRGHRGLALFYRHAAPMELKTIIFQVEPHDMPFDKLPLVLSVAKGQGERVSAE
jgi:hypothetical protein